jgi:DNA polymerase-4
MAFQPDKPFNDAPALTMHVDMNSCFASIEQQAHPRMRGKPLAVAAYTTPSGCIVAPSIEAKRHGIKVGMRVKDGKELCPSLIVLAPDPPKYRYIHQKYSKLLLEYTDKVVPKSIDEFSLEFNETYPAYQRGLENTAREIKQRISEEIGDWLKVNVGIGTNRFLAKTGAGLHKPDGLDVINHTNYLEVYKNLTLTDLCGIDRRNAARLHLGGIYTVIDFYNAPVQKLVAAFHSILGYYWYMRLHGWEIDNVDFDRKSFGNSYSLPILVSTFEEIAPILTKLVVKMSTRLRKAGFHAHGVHVGVAFRDLTYWHQGAKTDSALFTTEELYKELYRILCRCPHQKPMRVVSVSCFNLVRSDKVQFELFDNVQRKENLSIAVDTLNERWGDFCVVPALMLNTNDYVPDRVAFGSIKELEDMVISENF